MTIHKTGTRDEWFAARIELLQAEKELTRRGDALARKRQDLPWVRLDKDYVFDTDQGQQSLRDLFGGRSQLLVYHFMFGPDWSAGCPSCSMIATMTTLINDAIQPLRRMQPLGCEPLLFLRLATH